MPRPLSNVEIRAGQRLQYHYASTFVYYLCCIEHMHAFRITPKSNSMICLSGKLSGRARHPPPAIDLPANAHPLPSFHHYHPAMDLLDLPDELLEICFSEVDVPTAKALRLKCRRTLPAAHGRLFSHLRVLPTVASATKACSILQFHPPGQGSEPAGRHYLDSSISCAPTGSTELLVGCPSVARR